ncbi:SGNH/GDSL hydrolase family protein [Devosia lacusdianchii]|uniref:SGNH/GDSL hydrolase family protein n=1 Tax=Devosia lacusdianchii TaxID=2917991 RepID=UPI001F064B46|nr:SGNH/GDSL hydrolase family protein [Devosia sp. JXJ CY 41]
MQDGTNPPLNILAYGDSNTWGAIPQPYRGAGGRFGTTERWTRIMGAALGPQVEIFEEGLNGRTTCVDDPIEGPIRNGERYLPIALTTHMPLDLVIIMLGTNDLKTRLSMQAGDIADGAGKLVDIVKRSGTGRDGSPSVLLVAPAPLAKLTWLADMFEGGSAKSQKFAAEYARVAKALGVPFFDAGTFIQSSDDDGIHLDAGAHRALGLALAERVQTMLGLAANQG